jgi:hyaluronoglucosaminidase
MASAAALAAATTAATLILLLHLPFTAHAQHVFPSRYTALWNSPYPASCASGGQQPSWSSFNISTNANASFLGNTIATLYEAGNYPMFEGMGPGGSCSDGDWNCTNSTSVFGGLPQLTNLTEHLAKLRVDVEKFLPDANWSGVANIDWEAWKPSFAANKYNEYWIYVNRSEELVIQQHPTWSPLMVTVEAEKQFNAASQKFWSETMRLCRQLRPGGVWGFYNYPVDAWDGGDGDDDATLDWLYDEVTALFPSIYLYKLGNNTSFNEAYVDGVLNRTRAVRDARHHRTGDLLPMYSFTWYDYDVSFATHPQTFLSPEDLHSEMTRGANRWGLSGAIVWGASADVEKNTTVQCGTGYGSMYTYIEKSLGPALLEAAEAANNCSRVRCSEHGTCWGEVGRAACDCDRGFSGADCSDSSGY